MRLTLDSQQSEVKHNQGVESKCKGWVNQEVTLICKGRSSPSSSPFIGVSKLLHLEWGSKQLAEPRQQILVLAISLPYSFLIIVIYFANHLLTSCICHLDFILWKICF